MSHTSLVTERASYKAPLRTPPTNAAISRYLSYQSRLEYRQQPGAVTVTGAVTEQ